jgi:hypothetical protein
VKKAFNNILKYGRDSRRAANMAPLNDTVSIDSLPEINSLDELDTLDEIFAFSDMRLKNVFDSCMRLLLKGAGTKDTIFLSQAAFDRVEEKVFDEAITFEPLYQVMTNALETGQCAIKDRNNKRVVKIIRQKGEWWN